jgi:ADP-ribose pyrophosphatase
MIPKDAKLVFEGIIFKVFQWQQKQLDGSYSTFEGIKRPNTIQVIPTMGGKVLFGLEEQPMSKKAYSFFGGRQEEGESPLECAKRELLEETGLSSDDWTLWKSYTPSMKMEWDIHVFIAKDCRKVAEPRLEPGE